MSFYGVGFRRSRKEMVLDVTYPVILNDKKRLSEIKAALKISDAGIFELSPKSYFICRDLAFFDLPFEMNSDKVGYAKIDPVFFELDDLIPSKNALKNS